MSAVRAPEGDTRGGSEALPGAGARSRNWGADADPAFPGVCLSKHMNLPFVPTRTRCLLPASSPGVEAVLKTAWEPGASEKLWCGLIAFRIYSQLHQ